MKNEIKLCFLLFLIVICGCKKAATNQSIYLDKNFRSQFDFKPGSYWIMYDTLANKTDSLYISVNSSASPAAPYLAEHVKMTIIDSGSEGILTWGLTMTGPNTLTTSMPGDSLYQTGLLTGWPVNPSGEHYDTYYDMANVYHNVYVRHIHYPALADLDCAIVPGIGFVVLQASSSHVHQSLHLLRYHIEH